MKQERDPFSPMRDVSPGWANSYAGLWSLWMALPLALRWLLGLAFLGLAGWQALT